MGEERVSWGPDARQRGVWDAHGEQERDGRHQRGKLTQNFNCPRRGGAATSLSRLSIA